MFGLKNTRGSCWVNATLQALFRIPQVQKRYDALEADSGNPTDLAMNKIWSTQGDGLPEFYSAVRTPQLPAGENIGDRDRKSVV